MFDRRRRRALIASALAATTVAGTVLFTAATANAAVVCQVTYTAGTPWPGGFQGGATINNLGDPLAGWTLRWTFTAGQSVYQGWGGDFSQNGSQVTVINASWNGSVPTGGSVSVGFLATWNDVSNPPPTGFSVNNVPCTGSGGGTSSTSSSSSTSTSTSSSSSSSSSSSPPPPPAGGPIGWATQGGGTTGGAGGPTVTVTSLAALTSAVQGDSPQTVRVSGNFSCSDDVRLGSNKTILGVGSGSGLTGCGLNMRNVNNVIVRNMRMSFVPAGNGNGDAIHIDHATRIWIDHNELFSNTSSGTDFYDGLLDCTHACDYVTVSWNYFHDHVKCSLVGHSDNNASEDIGHLRMTYHHNWVNNCSSRNPRVRFGNPVHVFNNYYVNIADYGIASTENGGVLVEGNYFENVGDPFHLGEGSSDPGSIVARNNVFVNSGSGQAGGSVGSIPYSYVLDNPSGVKASVMAGAGVGKIST